MVAIDVPFGAGGAGFVPIAFSVTFITWPTGLVTL